MNYSFTIEYYELEEEDRPELTQTDFKSIEKAGAWAQRNYIPLYVLMITEWEQKNYLPVKVGSCNLDEAFSCNYTSLT